MMKVVDEEGTLMDDFITYVSVERQRYTHHKIVKILGTKMDFDEKDEARRFFQILTQKTKDWNYSAMESYEFLTIESEIDTMLEKVVEHAQSIQKN